MAHLPHFPVNLRRARRRRDLTQAELARRAGHGLTQQHVSTYERGLTPSNPYHASALADALGVSVRTLMRAVRP
jgi:transcriptional regulator with XRE-family HTH domain